MAGPPARDPAAHPPSVVLDTPDTPTIGHGVVYHAAALPGLVVPTARDTEPGR